MPGVSSYAAVHAAVRSRYAGRITASQFTEFSETRDFPALLVLLRDTAFGPYLAKVEEKNLTPRRVIYQIRTQLADLFQMVIRLSPINTQALFKQLFRRYEVDNLKAVLRSTVSGAPWDQVRYVLFPLGSIGVPPTQEMAETKNVNAAIELLRDTPYYATLSHAMERYSTERNLFPLEVALDLDYWRKLWDSVNQLQGMDREQAVRVIGSLLDMNNLMWAIRYREYYHLSEEEIINYTLPFGFHVHDENIRAIAAGTDVQQEVHRLYPEIRNIDEILQDPRARLPELEIDLERHVVEQCKSAFAGYPFHVGIPLAFLILKEFEIQDLTVLIEAKSAKMPVEKFQPYLAMGAPAR